MENGENSMTKIHIKKQNIVEKPKYHSKTEVKLKVVYLFYMQNLMRDEIKKFKKGKTKLTFEHIFTFYIHCCAVRASSLRTNLLNYQIDRPCSSIVVALDYSWLIQMAVVY